MSAAAGEFAVESLGAFDKPTLNFNCSTGQSNVYEVGPGHYAHIGDVPWTSLPAGSVVCIDYAGSPYHEKWNIPSNRFRQPTVALVVLTLLSQSYCTSP